MRIKGLFISGFKSFHEAAEIEIDSGLTAIVGPNGCGKSNLVDAVRWVTGESSARRLRGEAMDDVIFAGAESAPASRVARVALKIDEMNGEGPAMFAGQDELNIERRIRRGASSDFRINGRSVRSADVKLIFADIGAGAESPGMVTQGRVSALLAARPSERRKLLEEAAEVSGLDQRRHDAEGRIRRTETNLTRVEDALLAMSKQREALVEQAETAKQYREVATKIRTLDAAMHVITWRKAKEALATAGQRLQQQDEAVRAAAQAVVATRRVRDEQVSAVERLRLLLERRETTAQQERDQLSELVRKRDQAEIRLETARNQIQQLEQDRTREVALMADSTRTLESRRTQLAEMTAKLSQLESQDSEQAIASSKAELTELLRTSEARLEEIRATEASRRAEMSSAQQRLHQAEQRLVALEAESQRLAEHCQTAADALEKENVSGFESSLEQAENALAKAENLMRSRREDLTSHNAASDAQRQIVRETENMVSKQQAELGAIAALLAAESEGGDEASAPLISEARTSEGYEHALGAALGNAALAGRSGENFWRLLPTLPPAEASTGVIPLAEHAQVPEEWRRLLSQVWLVRDPAHAEGMQAKLAPGQCLVTRDGGLWRWDGFVRMPGAPDPAASLLEQAARHDELSEALAQTQADCVKAQTQLDELTNTQKLAETALADSETLVSEARQRLRTAERATLEARTRISRQQASLESAKSEQSRTQAAISEHKDMIAHLQADISRFEGEHVDEEELSRLQAESEAWRQQLAAVSAEASRMRADLDAARERVQDIQGDISGWESRGDAARARINTIDERLKSLQSDLAGLEQAPDVFAEKIAAQNTAAQAASAALDALRKDLSAAETDLSVSERDLAAQDVALATAQERRVGRETELAARREALDAAIAAMQAELSSTPAQAMEIAGFTSEDETPAPETISRQLSRLQQERDEFGPVNLLAEQQLEEIETSLNTLEREQTDLRDALERFSEALADLESEARRRLKTVFEQLNANFKMLFAQLFDGGEAYLTLSGEEDPLHAGLEVYACPPGKRLQTMSLMSGGEQALTALALIFSMFLVRPGPLCVLDEVDAPLDDANVERFCNLVESMAAEHGVRFLIITHHRLTMARVNRLIGVTMPNEGRSQIVSVNLEQALEWSETPA